MSVVLNPTEQLSGETTFTVITVDGENNADAPVIAGVTGNFADSLLGAEVNYSEATGEVNVTARFGMGHMATSASAATTMAQNWWMQSIGSFDKRNLQQLAGLEDAGVSAWATVFQEEGSVDPTNELQDVSFDQKLTGVQTGIEWQGQRRRWHLQHRTDVQLRQCLREPERQHLQRDGRCDRLRPERRLSIQQRPVPERGLAADGDGDRLPHAGDRFERHRHDRRRG